MSLRVSKNSWLTWLLPGDKVYNQTMASDVALFWDALGIPRAVVRLTLIDNAGYCKKAFNDHLMLLFPNPVLRTYWAHSGTIGPPFLNIR